MDVLASDTVIAEEAVRKFREAELKRKYKPPSFNKNGAPRKKYSSNKRTTEV